LGKPKIRKDPSSFDAPRASPEKSMLSGTGLSFSTVFLEKARKSIFNTYLTGAVAVAPWKERAREKMRGTMTAAAPPRPESRTERKWTVLQQP
jgi:hypothetical protein